MSSNTSGERIIEPPAPRNGAGEKDRGFPGRVADVVGWLVGGFDWLLYLFRARWLYCGIERPVRWLIGSPLLSGQIALYLGIAWGIVGAELGLTDLFWHEAARSQFWVGVATCWLFGTVLFVNILLRGFARDRLPDLPTETNWTWRVFLTSLFPSCNPGVRRIGRWMFYWLVGLAVVVYIGKLVAIQVGLREFPSDTGRGGWDRLPPGGGAWFLIGYACGFLAIYLLSVLDAWLEIRETVMRRPWLVAPVGVVACLGDPEPERPPRPGERGFYEFQTLLLLHAMAITTAFTILTVLGVVLLLIAFRDFHASPAVLLSLLLMFLDIVGGFIAFRVRGARTLAVVLLLAVMVANWDKVAPHKMTYPDIADPTYNYDNPLPLGDGQQTDRARKLEGGLIDGKTLLEAFKTRWQNPEGAAKRDTKPRLVIVAVSGGGIRAAVWTGVVLEGLEKEFDGTKSAPAIRDHIRVITGASGGMVGAAAYAANFDNGPLPQTGRDEGSGLLPFSGALAEDSLSRVVQTMIVRDFTVNTLLPLRAGEDRGRTLEWVWNKNFKDWRGGSPFEKSLRSLHAQEAASKRPSLVFAPIMVEDGKRLFVSNLDLGPLTVPEAHRLDGGTSGKGKLGLSGVEFFRLFPHAKDFKVGSAARMSATFPVVSPAVALPVKPIRRVVDAGYFDNYGVDILTNWLLLHRQAVIDNTSGVLLIQVRAYPLEAGGLGFPDQPQSPLDLIVGAVSAPLQALLTARGSSAFQRNNALLAETHRVFNGDPKNADFFTTVTFEQQKDAALSWYLTTPQKRQVADAWAGVELKAIKEWFGNGGK